MIVIAILIVIAVLLLIAAASRERTPREDDSAPSAELPGEPLHFTWEKNHFINKHLHRDDKTLERHKRNQFPF